MNVSQLRKEFSVFVVDGDLNQAQSLVETIKATGYEDTQYIGTLEGALALARENPPHLVLFDYERYQAAADSFLVDLRAISSEILVILMVSSKQALPAFQLVGRGLAYDSITRPIVSTLELVQKMDRASERLFYQFESEQLKEHLDELESESGDEAETEGGVSSHAVSNYGGLNEFLSRMNATKELDQAVQLFMESVSKVFGDTPVLYFKYVPSHMSLLVSQAVWLPIEKIRGIGVDLKKEDPAQLPALLQNPSKLEPLKTLVQQVFRREKFTAFAHVNDGETIGMFVILDHVEIDDEAGIVQSLRRVFDLAYKRNLTLKEKHSLDTTDALTGLVNRRSFGQKLDEEISRSRRILMPVSLITLDIDNIKRLNDRIGFQQTDSILKMLAVILKKTARVSDIIARTGPDEIAFLLPHTAAAGAAVKAERVRRIVESTRFPLLEGMGLGPLTVSVGVSEYPSFCNDAEGLQRAADEAMLQVKRAGGNKVCLASAPPGFQMDFTPREVPPATGAHSEGLR